MPNLSQEDVTKIRGYAVLKTGVFDPLQLYVKTRNEDDRFYGYHLFLSTEGKAPADLVKLSPSIGLPKDLSGYITVAVFKNMGADKEAKFLKHLHFLVHNGKIAWEHLQRLNP